MFQAFNTRCTAADAYVVKPKKLKRILFILVIIPFYYLELNAQVSEEKENIRPNNNAIEIGTWITSKNSTIFLKSEY